MEDDKAFLDKLSEFQNGLSSSFEDVPPDHWAYKAVKHLAELGLLEGYAGKRFRGDEVVTRYELAQLISKIFDNYIEVRKTGHLTIKQEVQKEEIVPRKLPTSAVSRQPSAISQTIDIEAQSKISDLNAQVSGLKTEVTNLKRQMNNIKEEQTGVGAKVSPELPSMRSYMERISDAQTGVQAGTYIPNVAVIPRSSQTFVKSGLTALPPASKPSSSALTDSGLSRRGPRMLEITEEIPPQPQKEPEEEKEETIKVLTTKVEEVEKKITLTQKDVDILEKLVNDFKKELKDINKKLSKDIAEGKKISLKNEKQIGNLKDENERFRVTGANEFLWATRGYLDFYERKSLSNDRTVLMEDALTLNLSSKPKPAQDLTIGAELKARTQFGGRKEYKGYIEGTSTAMTINNISVDYKDLSNKNPRNFKLRNLTFGNTSVFWSPLTVMGKPLQGINATLLLNKYTVNFFGARTRLHQRMPFFVGPDDLKYFGDELYSPVVEPNPVSTSIVPDYAQYDQYLYGVSLSSSLFGNPNSMAYLSRLFMFDSRNSNYPGCKYFSKSGSVQDKIGAWIDLKFPYDPYNEDSARREKDIDLFCLPPEKNSITSFFFAAPFFGINRVNIKGEFAHSTYYKEPYNLVFWGYSPLQDDTGYKYCDTSDPAKKYNCWTPVRGKNHQDDAFLIMFDYNKGPITIFPIGYIRLGPEFVTKNFGLPGFDTSMLNMSILPIAIQSLELYIANLTIKKPEDNYEYTTYFGKGGETKPMYLDIGGLQKSFSGSDIHIKYDDLLSNAINNLNQRTSKIKLKLWNNAFKYYFTKKITFDIGYTYVQASLSKTCLDGNIVEIKNEKGEIIDKVLGNGIIDCKNDVRDIPAGLNVVYKMQTYKMFWDTSKKAKFTSKLDINDLMLNFDYGDENISKIVSDLVPSGKYFKLSQNLEYKLADTTSMNLFYFRTFDTLPEDWKGDSGLSDTGDKPTRDFTGIGLKVTTTF